MGKFFNPNRVVLLGRLAFAIAACHGKLTASISPRIFRPMQTQLISADFIIAKRLWLALLAHCRSALLF